MMDVEKVADGVFKAVQAHVDKALAPLLERLAALEAKEVPTAASIVAEILGGDQLATLVNLEVAEAVSKIELPEPIPGEKGADGKDGIGLAGALIDRDGSLVVTLSNGEAKSLGPVVGRDGQAGKDGADGLGFDDMTATFDGEAIQLTYAKGERSKVVSFPVPTMKHIGFWRDGMEAKAGSTTTENGSLWLCLKDTSERPTYNSADWILAARKGRDGQDKTDAKPSETVKLNGH
jgi:hypothetical protein